MLFRNDLRRMLRGPKLYISYVVALAMLLRPLFDILQYKGLYSFVYLQSFPYHLSDFVPFAAIFCVLPFADSFCEDYNSGFVHAVALRIGAKRYAWQKAVATAFSGGLCMGLIKATVLTVCYLCANVPDDAESVQFMWTSLWYKADLLLRFHGLGFFAGLVLTAFLFGCLWASVGLCVSTVVTNKYVTLIAPFAIYQFLWLFVPNGAYNPVYGLHGENAPSFLFLIGYPLLLTAVCCVCSVFGIRKKVKI